LTTVLFASVIVTWIAFSLTVIAPPRSPMLRAAKIFLAIAFAWLVVESCRIGMLVDENAGRGGG
jgi:hypothetical protein